MKPALKHIINFVLILSITLSTAGIPVFAHTCSSMGDTEVSVMPEDHGCCSSLPEENLPLTKTNNIAEEEGCIQEDPSCCILKSGYFKTELPYIPAPEKPFTELPVIQFFSVLYNIYVSPAQYLYSSLYNKYPETSPPSGRALLHQISILRI